MRLGRGVAATGGELQVRAGPGDGEETAVVAVVVVEAADLGESEPLPIEGDDRGEPVGVAGDALDDRGAITAEPVRRELLRVLTAIVAEIEERRSP